MRFHETAQGDPHRNLVLTMVLGLLAIAGTPYGCSDEKSQESPAKPQPEEEPAPAAEQGASRFAAVELHAGFSPDPHVVEGTSGGQLEASTLRKECKGWVSKKPDFVFEARDAFAELRVMAHAEGDVTLVLTEPDGDILCNDDTEPGRTPDPLLTASIVPGTYEVRVGSFAKGEDVAYKLAFSELDDMTPAKLER